MQNRHSGMRLTYKCHYSGDKFDYLPGREDPLCPMNTVLVPVQSDFQFSIFCHFRNEITLLLNCPNYYFNPNIIIGAFKFGCAESS